MSRRDYYLRSVRASLRPSPRAASAGRLAWLDALRGFAALCVVFDHGSTMLLEPVRNFLYHVLNLGQYGVFVFFLVSGYIVPASLERMGSVPTFWVSRAFRLYPMYVVALILAGVAQLTGYGDIAGAQHHPLTSAASWLLMLPNLLTGPNVPNVAWTLSYEMVFYLLLAALFSWRVHRHSGGYALTCSVAAVAFGGIIPVAALTRWAAGFSHGPRTLDLTADALILAGVAFAVSGGRAAARAGATGAAVAGLVLVTFNQGYPYPWSGFTILALMFTGTLIYRAGDGRAGKVRAAWIAGAVLVLIVIAGLWHGGDRGSQWQLQWASSVVGAAATFAVGLAVRHRRIPRALTWLGLISYSVYLLHPLVLNAYRSVPVLHEPHPIGVQLYLAAAVLAVIIAASAVTFYAVERPMQRLGRRERQSRPRPASRASAHPTAARVPSQRDLVNETATKNN